MKTLRELKKGQVGRIMELLDSEFTSKLFDMGCLPGEEVKLKFTAPLGDPICIALNGYDLVLRKEEASKIIIEIE